MPAGRQAPRHPRRDLAHPLRVPDAIPDQSAATLPIGIEPVKKRRHGGRIGAVQHAGIRERQDPQPDRGSAVCLGQATQRRECLNSVGRLQRGQIAGNPLFAQEQARQRFFPFQRTENVQAGAAHAQHPKHPQERLDEHPADPSEPTAGILETLGDCTGARCVGQLGRRSWRARLWRCSLGQLGREPGLGADPQPSSKLGTGPGIVACPQPMDDLRDNSSRSQADSDQAAQAVVESGSHHSSRTAVATVPRYWSRIQSMSSGYSRAGS